MQDDVEVSVRDFIAENFLFREDRDSVAEEESLLESGLIDSTGVLELIAFLETEIGINIKDAEIVPENFDSIKNITTYAKSKLDQAA